MIAQRLIELRHKKGITQQDVATNINISRTTYAHYEISRREPDNETLAKIANFFGVSTDYLLGLTDLPKPYVLNENSPLYTYVLAALKDEKEGFTPADIKEANPEVAKFMEENNIIKAKAKLDLIERSGLSLEILEKLVALHDQIKKDNTGN